MQSLSYGYMCSTSEDVEAALNSLIAAEARAERMRTYHVPVGAQPVFAQRAAMDATVASRPTSQCARLPSIHTPRARLSARVEDAEGNDASSGTALACSSFAPRSTMTNEEGSGLYGRYRVQDKGTFAAAAMGLERAAHLASERKGRVSMSDRSAHVVSMVGRASPRPPSSPRRHEAPADAAGAILNGRIRGYHRPPPPTLQARDAVGTEHAHNHEYYSRERDYHGLYKYVNSSPNAQRRARTLQPPSTVTMPLGMRLATGLCEDVAMDAPEGIDDQLEAEYLTAAAINGLPPTRYTHELLSEHARYDEADNTPEAVAGRRTRYEQAMAGTLDRQLQTCLTRLEAEMRADAEAASNGVRRSVVGLEPRPTNATGGPVVLRTGEELLLDPTAYELRRVNLQQAPPIRSVKSIAERPRLNDTVLRSTRRIIEPIAEGAEPPRRAYQRERAEAHTSLDSWKVKVGLMAPTDLAEAYNIAEETAPMPTDIPEHQGGEGQTEE